MSLYQFDEENFSSILILVICSSSSSMSTHSSPPYKTFIPRALKFDSAKSLAKPCPFTSFVGLISKSNS
jgi:hypothetical protein